MRSARITCTTSLLVVLSACADSPVGPAAANHPVALDAGVAAISVAMSNLNSPRGMAWGPEGGLYVVEAGLPVATTICATVARGQNCYSGTGSVSRLWKGEQERVATGLPSAYNPTLTDIIGPQDIAFQGRGGGYVTIGWGGDPAARAQLGALGDLLGTLIALEPSGQWRLKADVAAFEGAQNPAGGPVDANPYGLLAEPGVRFVVDAGGNSLLEVRPNGSISLVAAFAPIPVPAGPFNPPFAFSDAVPTAVARGPDGALYVSTLTGAPFLPGAAAIYRVVPGQSPQLYAGGFTQITDFAWAPDGSLYVVQHASAPFFGGPGALIHVAPDGTRTVLTTALQNATGVLVGREGAVYVSHKVHAVGAGEVLKIVP